MLSLYLHPKDKQHKVATRLYHLDPTTSEEDQQAQNTQWIHGGKQPIAHQKGVAYHHQSALNRHTMGWTPSLYDSRLRLTTRAPAKTRRASSWPNVHAHDKEGTAIHPLDMSKSNID